MTQSKDDLLNCNANLTEQSHTQAEMYYSDLVFCMRYNRLPTTIGVEVSQKDPQVNIKPVGVDRKNPQVFQFDEDEDYAERKGVKNNDEDEDDADRKEIKN